ncbi:hypothetical protein JTB14_011498 [Gonioctena quinquepunctata]|nr:hypothetical protein JTB14_011498 [Gonioctena quinquepunctata]
MLQTINPSADYSNLLTCFNSSTSILNSGNLVDVIKLDSSGAFDKVPHKRLAMKLEYAGSDSLRWIQSFLHRRRFRVKVEVDHSQATQAISGIPQGSVLEPILFLVYTAKSISLVHSHASVNADDTNIFGNPITQSASMQSGSPTGY